MTNHFANSVDKKTQQKLKQVAQEALDNLISEIGESYCSARIDEVSGQPYDGFIPHQLGGYEVSDFIRLDTDASFHIDETMTDNANKHYEYLLELAKDELGFDCSDWDKLTEEQQEQFSEFKNENFEPALLRFEIWVQENNSIFARLSVNDTDQPYYRSSYDRTLVEKELTSKEFSAINIKEFIQSFYDAV